MRISSRISKKQNQAKGLPMVYIYTPNMFIAERFLNVSITDGSAWYPKACKFEVKTCIQLSNGKSMSL